MFIKALVVLILAIIIAGCSSFHDVPVQLTDVVNCDGDTPVEQEGNCYIRGKSHDGRIIQGPIFTMGQVGENVNLRCGDNWRCLPTARVISP